MFDLHTILLFDPIKWDFWLCMQMYYSGQVSVWIEPVEIRGLQSLRKFLWRL